MVALAASNVGEMTGETCGLVEPGPPVWLVFGVKLENCVKTSLFDRGGDAAHGVRVFCSLHAARASRVRQPADDR
jgi:hypothetical protein